MYFSDTEKFCTTMIKTEILSETDKNIDLDVPQSRKHKLSPDCEHVSKVAKYDIEKDTLSAVSFLNVCISVKFLSHAEIFNIFSIAEHKCCLRFDNFWK